MSEFDELLKDAIACNDYLFLETNKHKYDINHRFADENNDTLLLYAISDYGSNTYSFFIKNGADITLVNDEGEGIMHSIVYSGLSERLEQITSLPHGIDLLNQQTKDGTTPLLLSVLLGRDEVFNTLLELGANVDLSDETGNAPIHPACFSGNENMVSKLVEKHTNLHVKTKNGNYPLALAVNGDHDKIVRYLFDVMYN